MIFRNRLSAYPHYAVIKTQIANLMKLTALSAEAVSLISSNYSPTRKLRPKLPNNIAVYEANA